MPASFAASFSLNATVTMTPSNPVASGTPGLLTAPRNSYKNGVAAGQATTAYGKRLTVPAGSSVELDVKTNDGADDSAGQTVTLSRVIKVVLAGQAGQPGYFIIGGAVGSGWYTPFNGVATSVMILGGDESTALSRADATGFAVATGNKLKFANPGTADMLLDVQVWGS